MLMVTGAVFAGVSIGIRIGAPPPVRVEVQTASPGAGYAWVGGYWYPVGSRYQWHTGYWTRPAYEGATWVGPSHDGQRYHEGYWDGNRGHVAHDHRSDKNPERDHGRH